jgi:hypothetical protein
MIDTLIGFSCALLLVGLLVLASNRGRWRTPNWLIRLAGGVPWAPGLARTMVAVPNAHRQPTHEVYFVARQDLAECGLACPKCKHEVAERGDFSRVERSIIDGQENEVIKCLALIDMADGQRPKQCPAWLAAAPNTEHGDDLIEGDPPEFYKFSRITQAQALREKYGVEIGQGIDSLVADPKQRPADAVFGDAIPWAAVSVKAPGPEPATHPMQNNTDPLSAEQLRAMQGVVRPFADDETRILPSLTDPNKDT